MPMIIALSLCIRIAFLHNVSVHLYCIKNNGYLGVPSFCQKTDFFLNFVAACIVLGSGNPEAAMLLNKSRMSIVYSNYEDIGMQFDKNIQPNVHVSSEGNCIWFPPGRFSTPCPIEISWFPFDDQVCKLTFQSWLYNGFQVNVSFAYNTVDTNVMNGEWSLIGKSCFFSRSYRCMQYLSKA